MNLPDTYRGALAEVAAAPGYGEAAPDRINVRALFAILRRRIVVFVAIVGTCLALALLVTLRTPKLYTASADVVLRTTSEQITPGEKVDESQPQRAEAIETELQFLKSRDLAGKVADRLQLAADTRFVPPVTSAADAAMRERAVNRLLGSLDARRISTAYAIRITFADTDPKRAATIANTYAELYSADFVANKVGANREATEILSSRMDVLRRQAQIDFAAVQEYRIRNNLLSTAATSLAEQEISTYNQQVAIARAEAAQDRAKLATARAQLLGGTGEVGEGTASPVVQSLRSQRAMLSARVAELAGRYLDTHPELVSLRQQLGDIDAQIDAEINRTLFALDARARASGERLRSLESSLGGARTRLTDNNNALVSLDDLERRAQASQAVYESYLNRYREVLARSGAEQSNSKILSAATVPQRHSSPNMALNLTFGVLVGLLLGGAAAIVSESAYTGLTTGDDIEQRLRLRFLGGLPLHDSLKPHAATALDTIEAYPGGVFAESTRSLMASIRQSGSDRCQVIAVTSALPGEGKTTLSASLGKVVGMGHERVAVVDCDTVRTGLSRLFHADATRPGLRELLAGEASLGDVAVRDTFSGAVILPITTHFERGARLMESGQLQRLLALMREAFDVVILDCAPILPVAEVREIVSLSDSVVIVARWRKTEEDAVRAAVKLLPGRLKAVGVAFNAVDMRKRVRFGNGDASAFYGRYREYYGS